MIAGWVGLLLLAAVVADRPGHWHAALFIWGLAIGVVLALNQVITFRVANRLAR